MQPYNSISTIYVAKNLTSVKEQKGRGKFVGSIEEAVRVCCDLRRSGVLQPITVYLEKGEYEVARTLEFHENFYGVEFKSATGKAEDVVISGGRKVVGFEEKVFNGKQCFGVYLPEVKEGKEDFTDLYVNGERAKFSRFPQEGYLQFAEAENKGIFLDDVSKWVRLKTEDVKDLSVEEIENAKLTFLHYWVDEHTGVESYDRETGKLVMEKYSRFSITGEQTDSVYYLENVKSAFGNPGEWYLDKAEGMLYYMPRAGECIENLEVRIPRLSYVLNMTGTQDNPIKDVRFENVTFAYTKGDHDCMRDDGLKTASDGQGVSEARGTVNMQYARNCAFVGCKFVNYGLHGLNAEKGCSQIRIENCEFYDGGAGGIMMGGSDTFGDEKDRTFANQILNCKIHGCGRRHMAGCGILIKHSYDNRIVGNEIFDLFYSGISVGWVWGYKDSVTRNNYIADNHIYDLGKGVLSDMGGVYLLGAQPGTVVRGNRIHDIYAREYGGWAVYTDEGSAFIRVENNICYHCSDNCYHQHYGRMNVVKNNIFAFAGKELCRVTWGEQHLSCIFEHNILITDGCLAYGLLSREHVENGTVATGGNLIWSTTGTPSDVLSYGGEKCDLATAQSLGLETGSIYADPKCKDLQNFDFTLEEDSPAYGLGFQKIS